MLSFPQISICFCQILDHIQDHLNLLSAEEVIFSGQRKPSHPDAGLTSVKVRRKEGGLGKRTSG